MRERGGSGIDEDRGREGQTMLPHICVYAGTEGKEKKKRKRQRAKGGGRHISRSAFTYLCSFHNG